MADIRWTRDAGVYVSECKRFTIRKRGRFFVLLDSGKDLGVGGTLAEMQASANMIRDNPTTQEITERLAAASSWMAVAVILTHPKGLRRAVRQGLVAAGRRDIVLASIR